jgi:hypothetical protein
MISELGLSLALKPISEIGIGSRSGVGAMVMV